MSTNVFVTYPGTPASRFDREYYLNIHMPLVMNSWKKYGMEGYTTFFPEGEVSGTMVTCELRFRDDDALAAALAAEETPAVMEDIVNYTDIAAGFFRLTPL